MATLLTNQNLSTSQAAEEPSPDRRITDGDVLTNLWEPGDAAPVALGDSPLRESLNAPDATVQIEDPVPEAEATLPLDLRTLSDEEFQAFVASLPPAEGDLPNPEDAISDDELADIAEQKIAGSDSTLNRTEFFALKDRERADSILRHPIQNAGPAVQAGFADLPNLFKASEDAEPQSLLGRMHQGLIGIATDAVKAGIAIADTTGVVPQSIAAAVRKPGDTFNQPTTDAQLIASAAEALPQYAVGLGNILRNVGDNLTGEVADRLVGLDQNEQDESEFRRTLDRIDLERQTMPQEGESFVGNIRTAAGTALGESSTDAQRAGERMTDLVVEPLANTIALAPDFILPAAGAKVLSKVGRAIPLNRAIKPSKAASIAAETIAETKHLGLRAAQKLDNGMRWVARGLEGGASKIGPGIGVTPAAVAAVSEMAASGVVGIAFAGPAAKAALSMGFWGARKARIPLAATGRALKGKWEFGPGAQSGVLSRMARDPSLPPYARRTLGAFEYLRNTRTGQITQAATAGGVTEAIQEGLETYAQAGTTAGQAFEAAGAGAGFGAGVGSIAGMTTDGFLADLDVIHYRNTMTDRGDATDVYDGLNQDTRRGIAAVQAAVMDNAEIRLVNSATMRKEGYSANGKGVFNRNTGEVLINTDKVAPDELLSTVAHETGHAAYKNLPDELRQEWYDIAEATWTPKELEDFRAAYNNAGGQINKADRDHLLDELFAEQFMGYSGQGRKLLKNKQMTNLPQPFSRSVRRIKDAILQKMGIERGPGTTEFGFTPFRDSAPMEAFVKKALRDLDVPLNSPPMPEAAQPEAAQPTQATAQPEAAQPTQATAQPEAAQPEILQPTRPDELRRMIKEQEMLLGDEKTRDSIERNIEMLKAQLAKEQADSEQAVADALNDDVGVVDLPNGKQVIPLSSDGDTVDYVDADELASEVAKVDSGEHTTDRAKVTDAVKKAKGEYNPSSINQAQASRLLKWRELNPTRSIKKNYTKDLLPSLKFLADEGKAPPSWRTVHRYFKSRGLIPKTSRKGKRLGGEGDINTRQATKLSKDEKRALIRIKRTPEERAEAARKANKPIKAESPEVIREIIAKIEPLLQDPDQKARATEELAILNAELKSVDPDGIRESPGDQLFDIVDRLTQTASISQFEGATNPNTRINANASNNNPGNLESAARRTLESSPDPGPDFTEVARAELKAIRKTAPKLTPRDKRNVAAAEQSGIGGTEHSVHLDDITNRATKVWTPADGDSPLEYVQRIQLQNELFGDDIRVHGVASGGRIVTSQPIRDAAMPEAPFPTPEQITDYMADRGFRLVDQKTGEYTNGQHTVMDAHPDNFVQTAEGPVMIDSLITEELAEPAFDDGLRFSPSRDAVTKLASLIVANPDGFTFDLSGESPTSGFMVAPSKATEAFITPEDLTPENLDAYFEANAAVFDRDGVHLGGWFDRESGRYVLDASFRFENEVDARRVAVNADQDAIFDLGATPPDGEIRTKNPDGSPTNPELLEDSFDAVSFAEATARNDQAVGEADDSAGAVVDRGTSRTGTGRLPIRSPKVGKGASQGARDAAAGYLTGPGSQFNAPRYNRVSAERVGVDPEAARSLGRAFETTPDGTNDPVVQRAYAQLATEVLAQYEYAKGLGYTFEHTDLDPYANSADMMRDVRENKRLKVYKTADEQAHPLLNEEDADGLTPNDKFRAVHDLFGHAAEGNTFGPVGEERAWAAHVQMFGPEAARAMSAETKGQNSWVNYGPHMFDANGWKGDPNHPDFIPPQSRPYADQKPFLLDTTNLTEVTDSKGGRIFDNDIRQSPGIKPEVIAAVDARSRGEAVVGTQTPISEVMDIDGKNTEPSEDLLDELRQSAISNIDRTMVEERAVDMVSDAIDFRAGDLETDIDNAIADNESGSDAEIQASIDEVTRGAGIDDQFTSWTREDSSNSSDVREYVEDALYDRILDEETNRAYDEEVESINDGSQDEFLLEGVSSEGGTLEPMLDLPLGIIADQVESVSVDGTDVTVTLTNGYDLELTDAGDSVDIGSLMPNSIAARAGRSEGESIGMQYIAAAIATAPETGAKRLTTFGAGTGSRFGNSNMTGFRTWPKLGFDNLLKASDIRGRARLRIQDQRRGESLQQDTAINPRTRVRERIPTVDKGLGQGARRRAGSERELAAIDRMIELGRTDSGEVSVRQINTTGEGRQLWSQYGVGQPFTFDLTPGSDSIKHFNAILQRHQARAERRNTKLSGQRYSPGRPDVDDAGAATSLGEGTPRTEAEATANLDNFQEAFRFSPAPKGLARKLDSEPTEKVYRAMQVIDGKLYPPMSAKVKGVLREPTEVGVWEVAEEAPQLLNKQGKFVLDKANKSSVAARYNPYFHTSRTPLNDQFASAHKRPNLVTVEVEVPTSELTSGYQASGAKDPVGEVTWKAGPVSSKLANPRKVILSRYAKVTRVVPDSEVASIIADVLKDDNVAIPDNVVTPTLRAELERQGVSIRQSPGRPDDAGAATSLGEGTPRTEAEATPLGAGIRQSVGPETIPASLPTGKAPAAIPDSAPLDAQRVSVSKIEYASNTLKEKTSGPFAVKLANLVKSVSGFGDIGRNIDTPRKAYNAMRKASERVAENLLTLYDAVPPPIRSYWQRWYPLAREWNGVQGDLSNVPHWIIAGINARLSPGKDWIHNVNMTERILSVSRANPILTPATLAKAAEVKARARVNALKGQAKKDAQANFDRVVQGELESLETQFEGLQGKRFSDMPDKQAGLFARYETQANGDNRVLNYFAPNNPVYSAGISWQSSINLEKAVNILRNPTKENMSAQLGDAHKIRSFANNQIDPFEAFLLDVTMDTHATGAAYLTPVAQKSKEVGDNFGGSKNANLGISGTYPVLADGYRIAAERRGTTPAAMQSITWEATRSLFPPRFKTSENLEAIRDIWKQVERKKMSRSGALQQINEMVQDFLGRNPDSRSGTTIVLRTPPGS